MKTIRIWLLVLLAVLLPVRGAVAAAMLCPVGSIGMQSELRMHEHPASHEAMDHGAAHAHADHQHDHAGAGHHDDGQGQGASDKCNMCSAYCSLTPLVSEVPTLLEPVDLAAVKFPDLSSPAPTFLSDGQERPPRSI
ncbi:MAG: hypothetical protein HOQ10_00015 [Frateuria sp.]|nr:hypothetical protein [Frateuria sp.]